MSFNSITFSLYDLFGYLLPGYVALLALSLLELNFLGSNTLSLVTIGANPLVFAGVAYFLGQVCHALGGNLKARGSTSFRLSDGLYRRICRAAEEVYGVKVDSSDGGVHRRELYGLADAYLIASGFAGERDSLLSREGFAKTSTVAFGLLALVLLLAGLRGEVNLRLNDTVTLFPRLPTLVGAALALGSSGVFYRRFAFFNRLKVNRTQILFLAVVQQSEQTQTSLFAPPVIPAAAAPEVPPVQASGGEPLTPDAA